MIIVGIYVTDAFHMDYAIDWVIANCKSFEKYQLMELEFEERQERNCWFRLDMYFKEEKDAMMYKLRWE